MAFSIQQQMDIYFDNSGGGGAYYGGTGLGGGYGSIAGGGGSGRSGGSSGGAGSGGTKAPDSKLPFNPGDYRHQEHWPDGPDLYFNSRFMDEDGVSIRCNGWVVWENPFSVTPLPPCPKPIPVAFNDWFL